MAMTTKSSIRVKPHTVGQAPRQRHQCRADRTRPKLSDSGQEACRLEQEREGRVRRALGHGFMCRANNLIAVPCHAPAMPVCPTRAPVNPAFKIRIHDLKGTSQPIRPPRKRPPPNPNGFAHLLAQVALTHSRHKTTAKNTSAATMQGISARLRIATKSSVLMQSGLTKRSATGTSRP